MTLLTLTGCSKWTAYYRQVTEVYEVVLDVKNEEVVQDIIYNAKYGNRIDGEKLINSYSDSIEIDDIEII